MEVNQFYDITIRRPSAAPGAWNDVDNWCMEKFGPWRTISDPCSTGTWSYYGTWSLREYVFDNEEDAIMFTLRWA